MSAYYNEHDPYAAQWLRNLIDAGHIADGFVDERSIVEVKPDEIAEFTQCHFFAGIGGWSLAARLAGWPDDRPLWTGSCPCQPFSVAGKGKAQADERHLWPEQFRLIRALRPDVWMGEQVAAAIGKDWLDGVFADMEGIDYACGAVVVPACAVEAPHRRDRAWIVADTEIGGLGADGRTQTAGRIDRDGHPHISSAGGIVADTESVGSGAGFCEADQKQDRNGFTRNGGSGAMEHPQQQQGLEGFARHVDNGHRPGRIDAQQGGSVAEAGCGSAWSEHDWIIGHDGKARRVKPGLRLLAHGVPARVGKLRAYGNAIVPQVAAEIIAAYMECRP